MTEVYVWIGRQTTSVLRKTIMKLAREKFDQGYYKPPSMISGHHHGKSRKISLTATELPYRKQSLNRKMSVHKFLLDKENLCPRPSRSIFMSMFEQAEWIVFKEKFCDWPDESRIIRMKGGPEVCGELTKVWPSSCFFFILLSYTSSLVSRFRFINFDAAAVFVPVAYFFDTSSFSQF